MNVNVTNAADEVVEALTLGPTPGIQNWEVLESWIDGEQAFARLEVEGRTFILTIEPEAE